MGWLDYAQHCGFVTDTARVRHAKDKPRVERTVQYVRSNFWAGEQFVDLADAQARARAWCADVAGQRIHGTIQARPAEVFADREAGVLLPVPAPYDVPVFRSCKVHRDFHLEVGKALYSVPKALHRPAGRRARGLDAGQDVPQWAVGQGASPAASRGAVDRPGRPARREGRLRDAGPGPAHRRRPPSRPRRRHLRRAAAGRHAALDPDAGGLPAARAGPPLRRRRGQHRLRQGIGGRRRLRHEDRLDAGTRHREQPGAAAAPGRGCRRPVRPRPRRVRHQPARLRLVHDATTAVGRDAEEVR